MAQHAARSFTKGQRAYAFSCCLLLFAPLRLCVHMRTDKNGRLVLGACGYQKVQKGQLQDVELDTRHAASLVRQGSAVGAQVRERQVFRTRPGVPVALAFLLEGNAVRGPWLAHGLEHGTPDESQRVCLPPCLLSHPHSLLKSSLHQRTTVCQSMRKHDGQAEWHDEWAAQGLLHPTPQISSSSITWL